MKSYVLAKTWESIINKNEHMHLEASKLQLVIFVLISCSLKIMAKNTSTQTLD